MKMKRILCIIIFIVVIFATCSVFANNSGKQFGSVDFSEEYKQWSEKSDQEREGLIEPRMFDLPKRYTANINTSPLRFIALVGNTYKTSYSLATDIPENLLIKDQGLDSEICWAYSSLSSLETYLALRDFKANSNTKQYNFSERHMDYALVSKFYDNENNEIRYNKYGVNRNIKEIGNIEYANSYLTNGMGAVTAEHVSNDYANEDLDQIFSYKSEAQVYDARLYPSYDVGTDDIEDIKEQIKYHIINYGSLSANIYMPGLVSLDNTEDNDSNKFYNNENGALYCYDKTKNVNHAISIIGWDDNYSKNNFQDSQRPQGNGAWIVRNSWGTKVFLKTFEEYKNDYYATLTETDRIEQGINSPDDINEDLLETALEIKGFILEDNKIYCPVGKNGIMYISYEDVKVYNCLYGITKADDKVSYENLYQYNETNSGGTIIVSNSSTTIANIFEKQTEGKEYINQVGLFAPEEYTCKVFVNPNGDELDKNKMQQVMLKEGATKTIKSGFHTLEFAEPLEIKSDKFVVAIEVTGKANDLYVSVEINSESYTGDNGNISESERNLLDKYKYTELETGKCFIYVNNEWIDLSKIIVENRGNTAGDSTIKAYTIAQIPDDTINHIEITKEPTKKEYVEGEQFDTSGMEVTAFYNDDTSNVVTTGYEVIYENNTDKLQSGQTKVTIQYKGKTVDQPITVGQKNYVSISIKQNPTKMNYYEGDDFDKTGMIVEATDDNGNKEIYNQVMK